MDAYGESRSAYWNRTAAERSQLESKVNIAEKDLKKAVDDYVENKCGAPTKTKCYVPN
jgi:hypothetical protein